MKLSTGYCSLLALPSMVFVNLRCCYMSSCVGTVFGFVEEGYVFPWLYKEVK